MIKILLLCCTYLLLVRGSTSPLPIPIGSDKTDLRGRMNQRQYKDRSKAAEQKYLRQLEEYEYQRDLYLKKINEAQDRYYDRYFEQMMNYAVQVHIQRYQALLRQQKLERKRQEKVLRQLGLSSDEFTPPTSEENSSEEEEELQLVGENGQEALWWFPWDRYMPFSQGRP
uniref:Uncharacterized protein n=1 Tax=Haemonchus contortus TaxID=6289 RepID=A0A912LZX8_HAECO